MGEVWLAEAAWLSGQKTRLADQWEYFGDRKRLFSMRKTLLAFLLALVGLVPVFQVQAGGLIICHDIRILPHPVPPRPHPVFAPLELRTQKVDVKIENQVASTTVEQVFYNPNPHRREGTFLFPVPKGASIKDFRMDVNGKLTKAELLPADKARKIYTDIVRSMKDPALLAGSFILRTISV